MAAYGNTDAAVYLVLTVSS